MARHNIKQAARLHEQGRSTVALAWLHPGEVAGAFSESVADTFLMDGSEGPRRFTHRLSMNASPRLADARCEMVSHFLGQTKADWLLMVDADMRWRPEDAYKLLNAACPKERPILGGLCFAGGRGGMVKRIWPTLYVVTKHDEGGWAFEKQRDYPRDSIVQIDGTGAAFLLVHRWVFEAMRRPFPEGFGTDQHGKPQLPWFTELMRTPDGSTLGEDIAFCVRARGLDIPVHVHTGVKIDHRKDIFLNEELYDSMASED